MAEDHNSGEIQLECNIRRFVLVREVDDSGVSGTGIVAEGAELSSGKVVLTFRTHLGAVQILDSIKVLKHTSVHKGNTKIVWLDAEPFECEQHQDPVEESTSEENDSGKEYSEGIESD